jgi:hypothetical protein
MTQDAGQNILVNRLTEFGKLGVLALRTDVQKVSATGKTADSIRFEIAITEDGITLRFLAREFFKALETGRGPRKSSTYQQYDISLLEYMEARGMLTGLTDKQKKSKAKSLAWYINKHGDKTYNNGGRIVYSPTITKLVAEIKRAIISDFKKFYIQEILKA